MGGDASLSPALHVEPVVRLGQRTYPPIPAETRLRTGASLASRGRADKTLKLPFVRILPAAGDKTFTSDSVTRCSEHHIQRCVERFDDDCSNTG